MVFGIIYIPTLIIFTFLAINKANKLKIRGSVSPTLKWKNFLFVVASVISTCLITASIASLIKHSGTYDILALLLQALITILCPYFIGQLVAGTTKKYHNKKNINQPILRLNTFGIAALHSVWIFPIAFIFTAFMIEFSGYFLQSFTKEHKEKIAYIESRCQQNRININKIANSRAKSIYFSQDRIHPHETWLLWNQNIDFIETRQIGKDGKIEYLRIEKDLNPGKNEDKRRHKTISTRIAEPQAEYVIYYTDTTKKTDKKYHIYAKAFTIKKRETNEILANFSYVSAGGIRCPPSNISGVHTIAYILGTMNNVETKIFKKKIAKYHKSKK